MSLIEKSLIGSGGGGGGTTIITSPSEYTDVSNATVQLTKDDQFVSIVSDSSEAKIITPPTGTISNGHFIDVFSGARGNPQIIESSDALISAAPTVADIPVSNISLNGSAVDTSPLGQTTTTTGTVSYTSETINGQTHDVMRIAEGATGVNSVSVPVTPILGGEARTIFFQYRSEVDTASPDGHRILGMGDKSLEGGFLGLTTIYTDSLRIDINGRAFTYNNKGRPLRDSNWHSVAIVITNSTDDPKFYIDNFDAPLSISTTAGRNIPFDTKPGPITIGSWDVAGSESLPGLYSNFQMYDRALGGDDLSNLAIQGLLGAADLTALDIHERIRFVYNSSTNLWQASDATLLRILDYSERITALENPEDGPRARAVSNVAQSITTATDGVVVDFEVQKVLVGMNLVNGELEFTKGNTYNIDASLNLNTIGFTGGVETWVEIYDDTSSTWVPVDDSGQEKEFDYVNEGQIQYVENGIAITEGTKLRLKIRGVTTGLSLAAGTLANGTAAPSAKLSVSKV